MGHRNSDKQLATLKSLFEKTRELHDKPIDFQAHWAKYICVFMAGYIENTVREIFVDISQKSSSEAVANYVTSSLNKLQNPKSHSIVKITRTFKKKWGDDLESYLKEQNRAEAIDGVMSNRHLIAHGKDSGVTIGRLSEWLEKIETSLNHLMGMVGSSK